MPHPQLLTTIATTGVHIDISKDSYHPDLLEELMSIVVKSGGHLTVKGMHPELMLKLAQLGGKHLTVKW
ncbi:hypothetical protein [Klebsiella quasipneumoniae]|uniref:hypothetical protein n=1 Tax=Klebsiella quasipneumoniae TaxID=1463165 RepID=UPI0032DB0E61